MWDAWVMVLLFCYAMLVFSLHQFDLKTWRKWGIAYRKCFMLKLAPPKDFNSSTTTKRFQLC
jgi:hypothetical protein